MEPAVANGTIHTGYKQHQRHCQQICEVTSSVDWALRLLREGSALSETFQ